MKKRPRGHNKPKKSKRVTPSLWVMYDTNVYVGTGVAALAEIQEAERKRRIFTMASPHVLHEMLYRLAVEDVGSKKFRQSLAATKRVVSHCTASSNFAIASTRDELLANLLLGNAARIIDQTSLHMATRHCAEIDVAEWPDILRDYLARHRQQMDEQESAFIGYMQERVDATPRFVELIHGKYPTENATEIAKRWVLSDEGRTAMAEAHIRGEAKRHNIMLDRERQEELTREYVTQLGAALEFESRYRYRCSFNGYQFDSKENINDMWDWYIMMTAFTDQMKDGARMRFLTDETQLVDAAKRANSPAVQDWKEYLVEIGLPHLIKSRVWSAQL